MNRNGIPVLALLVSVSIGVAVPAGHTADAPTQSLDVSLGQGSTLWLAGTSTIHDYESRTSSVAVTLTRAAGATPAPDVAGLEAVLRGSGVTTLVARVPVATLRSGKTALDKNLQKAMRAEAEPEVRFVLDRYRWAPPSGDTLNVNAEGTLTIAGKSNPVTLAARLHRETRGIWLDGVKGLRMSDYGIRPPTMMLGTLRVADSVTVGYHLLLVPEVAETRPTDSPADKTRSPR